MFKFDSGLFVTFDGANGVGKSTIIELLSKKLETNGVYIKTTKEPTNTELGMMIRKCEDITNPYTLACLVAADRYNHINNCILKELQQNKIVLCDRYFASSLILQSLDGISNEFILNINKEIVIPNLFIILTAQATTLENRLSLRGSLTRLEREHSRNREVEKVLEVKKYLEKSQFHVVHLNNEDNDLESNVEFLFNLICELAREKGIIKNDN